jgi:hypothetical protein
MIASSKSERSEVVGSPPGVFPDPPAIHDEAALKRHILYQISRC